MVLVEESASEEIIRQIAFIKDRRKSWTNRYKDMKDFFLPAYGRNLDVEGQSAFDSDTVNNGERQDHKLLDGTTTQAVRDFAAGMQTGASSPASQWFRWRFEDPAMHGDGEARRWLDQVMADAYAKLARSNFYAVMPHIYAEEGCFGTACMLRTKEGEELSFRPFTVGDYFLDTDDRDKVVSIIIRQYYTASQMVSKYGKKNLPESVLRSYEQKDTETLFEVSQLVDANSEDKPVRSKNPRHKFRSVHVLEGHTGAAARDLHADTRILKISGFEDFPFLTPRWKIVPGNVYGESPAMDVLPQARMLQITPEKMLRVLDVGADPPFLANSSLKGRETINALPGGMTFIDEGAINNAVKPLYEPKAEYAQLAMAATEDFRVQVKQGMYIHLFQAIIFQQKTRTATETNKVDQEALTMLGPALQTNKDELFDPLLDWVFEETVKDTLDTNPPPPSVARQGGAAVKTEYVSTLAQAQKFAQVQSAQAFVGSVGALVQLDPEALDVVNVDGSIRHFHDSLQAASIMLNDEKTVTQIRENRAKEMAQAQALEQAQQAAGVAEKTARAVGPENFARAVGADG